MADSTASMADLKGFVADVQALATRADALGLANEAYKLRTMAVAGERTFRRLQTEAKRAAGEATPGRKPAAKS